ncbi:MAG: phosphocholine cytidylyltransferase family protein [Candidatus Pacebacteria bacterium]|nr:phosphocholine cytidylyltransferase family protein [Candidatus Paceibacterota bacterium]
MSTKAIILAAGSSRRLRPITDNRPKCLVELNGETILDYQLRCLEKCQVKEILIVAGYKKEMIREHLKKSKHNQLIKVICNDIFDKTDNTYSLSLALQEIDEKKDSVIVLDGDIIFDVRLLRNVLITNYKNVLIADNIGKMEAEDNKVLIKRGYVKCISKKIKGTAIYNSIIKLNGRFLKEFKDECKKIENRTEWYTNSLTRVLQSFPKAMKVIFTQGLSACEIDNKEDLIQAIKIYDKIKEINEIIP